MFKQKQRRKDPAISTLIGSDTRIDGNLTFTGGCLVDGTVRGDVKSEGGDDAMLSVSEQGIIEGAVEVPVILLNGTVQGDVRASSKIELGATARVIGNVEYDLIEMAIGAEVNGKLIHASENRAVERPANEPQRIDSGLSPIAAVNVAGDSK